MIEIKFNGKWYDIKQIIQFAYKHVLPSNSIDEVKTEPRLPDLELFIKLGTADDLYEKSWLEILSILSKMDSEQLGFIDAFIKSNLRVDINKVIKKWAVDRDYAFYPSDMDDSAIGESVILTANPPERFKFKSFDLKTFIIELSTVCNYYIDQGYMIYGDSVESGVSFDNEKERNSLVIEVAFDTEVCKDFCNERQRQIFVQYLADKEKLDEKLDIRTNAKWLKLPPMTVTDLTTFVNTYSDLSDSFDLELLHCIYNQCKGNMQKMYSVMTDCSFVKVNRLTDVLSYWQLTRPLAVEELITEKCELFYDLDFIGKQYKKRFQLNQSNAMGTYLMV